MVCLDASNSLALIFSPQSEEDKQLKEDLEMCVERLKVCAYAFTTPFGVRISILTVVLI